MNKFLVPFVVCVSIGLFACSTQQRETVPAEHDYRVDAEVMAQFVDVDRSTGLYFINPDKKFNAVDYVFAYSQEELMSVSPGNRSRFLKEMEEVNKVLSVMRKSAGVSALLYTTMTSNYARLGGGDSDIKVEKQAKAPSRRSHIVSLDIVGDRGVDSSAFRALDGMTLSVSSAGSSMFYLSMVNLVDGDDRDAASMVISGVNMPSCYGNYSISVPEISDRWVSMKGSNIIGDGTVLISLSE